MLKNRISFLGVFLWLGIGILVLSPFVFPNEGPPIEDPGLPSPFEVQIRTQVDFLQKKVDQLESMSIFFGRAILRNKYPDCTFIWVEGPEPLVFWVSKCLEIESQYPEAKAIYMQIKNDSNEWTPVIKELTYR